MQVAVALSALNVVYKLTVVLTAMRLQSAFDTYERATNESADAKKRCARCNTAYCSVTCQREAWKTHKKACGESPDMPTGQVCAAYVEMMRHPDVVKNVENTTMIDPRQVKVALLCGVKPEKLGPLFNHREDSWISGSEKNFIAALNASGAAKKSCSESFYHRVLCSAGSEELMKLVKKGPAAMAAAGGVRSSLKDTKTIISQALERAGRRQEEEKVSEAEDFRRFARDIAAPMGFELSDEALEAMCAEKGLSSTKRAEPQSQEHMAAAVDAGIVHESVLRKGRRKKGKGGRAAASGLAAWQKATADAEELRAALAAAEADAAARAELDAEELHAALAAAAEELAEPPAGKTPS